MSAKTHKHFCTVFIAVIFLAAGQTVAAQSSDQNLPTAVLSNEINGTIAALDLGDPRLTRHFYAFEGVPGDLVVTLDSRNLNGDLDIFTAVTLRPLTKISMYANTASPEVTKGLYLRTRQVLILRVEARTPNDESGSYRIRFSGAFAPFSGGIPVAETSDQSNEAASSSERRTNRVSSVGERIEELPSSVTETKPNEKAAEETATNAPSSATKSKSRRANPQPRTTRGRAARSTRNKPASTGTETRRTEAARTETTEEKKEAEGEEKSGVVNEPKPSTPAKPSGQETPPLQRGAHLIIEQKDGTKIDRPMTTVRRVVIEGGVIVVVFRSGRIERVPMSVVTRMSIEP